MSDPQPSPETPSMRVEQDEYEPCLCTYDQRMFRPPQGGCPGCGGSGYRLTRRIYRAIPDPNLQEQALHSRVLTLEKAVDRAARTLDEAADRFDASNLRKQGAATRAAAQALRDSTGVEA